MFPLAILISRVYTTHRFVRVFVSVWIDDWNNVPTVFRSQFLGQLVLTINYLQFESKLKLQKL